MLETRAETSRPDATATRVDTAILGGTGYVAGELLRLCALHPALDVKASVSHSKPGTRIADVFPHLRGTSVDGTFASMDDLDALVASGNPLAVFGALPHGESARVLDQLLAKAERNGTKLALVDLSADFRLPDAKTYEAVYERPHGAPERIAAFTCALPDLERETPQGPVAHPGCFTTAVSLACRPLHALSLCEPHFFVSAVTGSTGSGREPKPTTHHPERHADYRSYGALTHRHRIEMEALVGAKVAFVPHSGPFARGIHATVHAKLHEELPAADLAAQIAAHYSHSPFIGVRAGSVSLKEVVGTNRCELGVETNGREVVVFSVIDNLTKGAAGGGVHWMNRLLGLPEATGLLLPGLGWN